MSAVTRVIVLQGLISVGADISVCVCVCGDDVWDQ